jgi:hypothetical protein
MVSNVNTDHFSSKKSNRSFNKIKNRIILQTWILHGINNRLQKFTVKNIFNTKLANHHPQTTGINRVTHIITEYIKKQGS